MEIYGEDLDVPEVPEAPHEPEVCAAARTPYEVFMEVHRCNAEHPDLQVSFTIKPEDI